MLNNRGMTRKCATALQALTSNCGKIYKKGKPRHKAIDSIWDNPTLGTQVWILAPSLWSLLGQAPSPFLISVFSSVEWFNNRAVARVKCLESAYIGSGTQEVINICFVSYYKNNTYAVENSHFIKLYESKLKYPILSPPPEITISNSFVFCPTIFSTLHVCTYENIDSEVKCEAVYLGG